MNRKVLGTIGLIALPAALVLFLVFMAFVVNNAPRDAYYDNMPTGTAQELIAKYAEVYYKALDTRANYDAEAKKVNDKIEATKELSRKYIEAFNTANDLIEKACEANESEAGALFAEARQAKIQNEQLFAEWEAGNQTCGDLIQAIRPLGTSYEQIKEELERAERDYGIVISNCTRRFVALDTKKVMAAEKEYVDNLRSKAGSNSDLVAACDSYDQAYTKFVQVLDDSDLYHKRSSQLSDASHKAYEKYAEQKKAILTGDKSADEGACRQAYKDWQQVQKVERDFNKENASHQDDYSTASDGYKEAFHKALYLARPAK